MTHLLPLLSCCVLTVLALVVQKLDGAILWINHLWTV